MPVGLQRWPLNEMKGDLPPQPTICGSNKYLYNLGVIDGVLSKEDEQFGRGLHRVQEADGGKMQDMQKQLDRLRQIKHSLEDQVTKLDGMTEKANTRLEKAQKRTEEQTKHFGCIVELVQQLSVSRELEDLEEDAKPNPSKDSDNNIAANRNTFVAVDEKVQRKLHFPNILGQGPDYLEQLIQSHIPNYPITDCCGDRNTHGCNGGGKCRALNTGIPSTCVGTSSAFDDQHITLNSKGECVIIINNAPNEVDLGGHLVIQTLDGRRMASFALPARVPLPSLATVTIWSSGSDYKTAQPPTDFVYGTLNKWCTDAKCITILCSRRGQALAWTTIVKEATCRQQRLTSPPPFGEEKAPVIDLLSYVNMSPQEDKPCNQNNSKYVPFPPFRPTVPSYLPTLNRHGQSPIDALYESHANSPSSDLDEIDYVDMLLEYKEIQKKLEVINLEEGRLVEEKEKNKENHLDDEVPNCESKVLQTDIPLQFNDGLTVKLMDEEVDLEELELRRRCLESCQQRLATDQRSKSPVRRRPSFQSRRQPGYGLKWKSRPLSPSRNRGLAWPLRPRDRKRSRDESLDKSELSLDKSVFESRTNRSSPDPEEKFKKFVQLRTQMPDSSDGLKKKKLMVLVGGDNYDEVEMDLDSNNEEDIMTTGFHKSSDGEMKERTKQTEIRGVDGVFTDWPDSSGVHPGITCAPLGSSSVIYPLDLSSSSAVGTPFMPSGSQVLHGSRLEAAPQAVGYSLCPLRPDAQVVPLPYQPFEYICWGETLAGSIHVPRMSDVIPHQTTNLLGPNMQQGLSGGKPSSSDWLSWSASAIGSADPSSALFNAKGAVSGLSDELVPVDATGVEGMSSASPSANETVPVDDESNDCEEASLRQMLLMEMAGKRDKKEKQSTTAQDHQKPPVMPLMKVPVIPTSDILSSVTAQSAFSSSKSPAWPSLSQPSLAQSLLPSPSPPLLSAVPKITTVVRLPFSSNLTSITRTVSGFSLSSFADDFSRSSPVPPPSSNANFTASPVLPSRADMAALRVTFKAPLKKNSIRVPLPQHKPVVISLSGDTDSDSDDEEEDVETTMPSSLAGLSVSLLGNLDSFLKEVRQTTQVIPNIKEEKNSKSIGAVKARIKDEGQGDLGSSQETHMGPPADNVPTMASVLKTEPSLLKDESLHSIERPRVLKDEVGVVKKLPVTSAKTSTSVKSTAGVATVAPTSVSVGLETWRTDGRKVERKLLMRKLAQLKAEFKSESDQLYQEEQLLGSTGLEMTRKKGQYRQSCIRVEKLREQLSATEKIVKHNQQQVVVLNKKTQDLRNLSGRRKKKLQILVKEMSEAKRRLNGQDTLSKTDSSTLQEVTRQTTVNSAGDRLTSVGRGNDAQSATVTSFARLQSPAAAAAQPQSLNSIASEKKYLVELAKQLEQMIEISKQKQAAKSVAKLHLAVTKGRVKSQRLALRCVEHVETEEKMVFGKVSEGQRELVDIVPRRRRSLIDQSPTTTKPVLGEHTARDTLRDMVEKDRPSDNCPEGQLERSQSGSDEPMRFAAIQSITEGRLRQIRKVLNEHLNKQLADDGLTGVDDTDPFMLFQPPVEKVVNISDLPKKPANQNSTACASVKPYHSQLLCFRSYRFSPYYRTKEGRTIQSNTHKIDPNLPLCHFDLMGKCNDDNCPWQHERDYSTSHLETLIDIASYGPEVARVNSKETPVKDFSKGITQYVDEFVKQHSKLTPPQQALLLLTETYKHTELMAPHSVLTEPRQWKLSPAVKSSDFFNDEKKKLFASAKDTIRTGVVNEDDIILDQDVRYWMLETQEAEDMETAVADDPSNVQLWLKLAYKKMSDAKRIKPDETLALGLHVLSRALESNQTSETLWRHYLHLFGKRDATTELMNFYRMALNFAPSYYLYWKYLQLSKSFSEKMEVCKIIRQFLCSPRCHEEPARRSHHLLEIILYQAGLSIETGRMKSGRDVIESVVKSRVSVIWLNMVWTDRIIVWLAYIHLIAFRKLPMSLYDPADSCPGRIVNKVPFAMPWKGDQKPKLSPDHLMKHVDEAIQLCNSSMNDNSANAAWLCQLYRIKVFLEEEANGVEAAKSICCQTLEQCTQFEDLWIVLINLAGKHSPDEHESIHELISKALKHNPISVKIYLAGISKYVAQGDCEKALELAEKCVLALFDVDSLDPAADPNLLFCKLLDQTLPCTYQAPPLVDRVTEEWLFRHQADIWFCFCLLLDLQGAHEQASEAYQNAMSTIKNGSDLGAFCLRFLRRCYGSLRGDVPWSNPSSRVFQMAQQTSEFESHVFRVLSILPSKFPLPLDPDQTWISYSSHNQIIDFYIRCLSSDDCILKSFEKFITLMPTNIVLVKRACDFLMKRGFTAMCNGFCAAVLCEKPKAAMLWSIKLLLSHIDGNVYQMRRVFRMAMSSLPYSQKLWKDFMLFEIAQKNSESVRWIVQRCRELQINIEDALNAVIPSRS